MSKPITPENTKDLLGASTYREFIETWMTIKKSSSNRSFGYADVARAGGFASRSFPRDVAKGLKRISPSSINQFMRGLGLQGDWAEYFRLLVQIEETDCRDRIQEPSKLEKVRGNLTKRLQEKNSLGKSKVAPKDLFYAYHVPFVYAALGSPENGATVAQIRERSNLNNSEIIPILKQLIESGIVSRSGDHYFAEENHLNLTGLPANEIFKSFYFQTLSQAALNARIQFNSDQQLFFSSCVSVSEKSLPRLKEELRSVLLRFVDSAEMADGDKVISIAASMF